MRLYLGIARLAAVCLAAPASVAAAQNYPVKSIRIVVPFPAGGASDILSRLIGYKLTARRASCLGCSGG